MNTIKNSVSLSVLALIVLLAGGIGFYNLYPAGKGPLGDALSMSSVVLIGLALVVILMAVLVIVYSALGLANSAQALALPEGSVRALLAFSLVLVFVCMASFLYNSVNRAELTEYAKPLVKINEAQLKELKENFVVAYEPVRESDGKIMLDADGKALYNATYYSKRSKDGDDFAKQIFTTLATIFVSVVSFYFGSSTTAAGVGAGLKAGGADAEKKGSAPQVGPAGEELQVKGAQVSLDRATEAVKSVKALIANAADDKRVGAEAQLKKAESALKDATTAISQAREKLSALHVAIGAAASASADPSRASNALNAVEAARNDVKALAEDGKRSAGEAESLAKQIKVSLES